MTTLWTRLCELLDDDPALAPSVRAAAGADGDADAWTALLDGLDDAGALAYLDPHDTGVELAEALSPLPRVVRSGADLDAVGDVSGGLIPAIRAADRILAPHGLRLVHLEEDPDAYPLVVVPQENAAEIVELVTRLAHAGRVFPAS